MSFQEKLIKSLELLKKLSSLNNSSDVAIRKKGKIQHCHIITECIINNTLQTNPEAFTVLLNNTMEILFQLCDDSDSDVRMLAEECLNKIIRALNYENTTKVLIELHKEIKRNYSTRSLRAALSRFSKLAHHIRPHKGKLYVLNLFPSLIRIIGVSEEMVHETLSSSLPKIIEVLGPFTTDSDIKKLLNAFIANLSNPSPLIRRTTVHSIQNICLNCPRSYQSIVYCFNVVLGFLLPLNHNNDKHLVLGVLSTLKTLLPHCKKFMDIEESRQDKGTLVSECDDAHLAKLLQIYKLCLYYIGHEDHNLVNSSIETLNALLENSTSDLKTSLLNPAGFPKNKLQIQLSEEQELLSQLDIALDSPVNEHLVESELTESVGPDLVKFAKESKLTLLDANNDETEMSQYQSLENDSSTLTESFSNINLSSCLEAEGKKNCNGTEKKDDQPNTQSLENSASHEDLSHVSKDIYIGEFYDEGIPLLYCTRLLAKLFLLNGTQDKLKSDRMCRISVKSSSLSCISSILRLQPIILLHYLEKGIDKSGTIGDQALSDILRYSQHSDPQLRGITRILVASYLKSALTQSSGRYDDWMNNNDIKLDFKELMEIFRLGLEDSSSLCARYTLQALSICLSSILESEKCRDIMPIIFKLPSLATNPYWLIRVTLCEALSDIPYINLYYITGSHCFQNEVLYGVVLELMKDPDSRVRKASSNALVKLIPQLYFEAQLNNNVVTCKAMSYKKISLLDLHKKSWSNSWDNKHIIDSMPFPFSSIDEIPSKDIEFALSKVVSDLAKVILSSENEHTIFGYVETLACMSKMYPCTVFRLAWGCHQCNLTNDLLQLGIEILLNSSLAYDITFHTNLLIICSNLYAGFSFSALRPVPEDEMTKTWNMFESTAHSKLSDLFLKHVVRILNIYQHIIDEPYPLLSPRTIMLNLPTTSPIKRRKSDLERKFISPPKLMEEKNEKKEKENTLLGSFTHIPHYMKIYESLKTAYGNYKTSLEPEASEKILNMLKESLRCLSIMMEIGGLLEFGNIAEELLNYFNTIFKIEPSASVECVQQLLKSIFGSNLLAYGKIQDFNNTTTNMDDIPTNSGFYNQILLQPYEEISMCVKSLKDFNKLECDDDNTLMGYRHRNAKIRITHITNLDQVLANYIRIFEPMVIRSLKQYTITSDVKLQGIVLQLLSQLIQLKINYCLLDAEQIFITFVLNQFEYIEAGQIRNPEELIQKIFQFLVQLSYSKQHSKSIIAIPKIIQLCDGLTASGQCPVTHCIPAFKPIVEDIFYSRNTIDISDVKELETTREVVLAMLLKLMEYHEVMDLIIIILDDSKYSSDINKWLRWSQNVLSCLLSALKKNKYKLDDRKSFESLRNLIYALNPSVFRPIDDILILLFEEPPHLEQGVTYFTRWIGKIITIMLILSPVEEDIIISKICDLKNNFIPSSVFENIIITPDPLNVTNSADFFQHLSSEKILMRFVFRTLNLASKKCTCLVEEDGNTFFIEEVSLFMLFCLYNFQSGFLIKTANLASSLIAQTENAEEFDAKTIQDISDNFQSLIFFYPTLTVQWCYVLMLLGYEQKNFWSSIINVPLENEEKFYINLNSINSEVVKTGSSIILCDYLAVNSRNRTDLINLMLEQNLPLLVHLQHEPTLNSFFSVIRGDPELSQNLLLNIELQYFRTENLVFQLQLLESLENIHPKLTGQVIKFLLEKMIYTKCRTLTKEISKTATRKLELLLTMPVDIIHNQLEKEDLTAILSSLCGPDFNTKYVALLGILKTLGSKFYGLNVHNSIPKTVNSSMIKTLELNKEWYISKLRDILNNTKIRREIAQMISILAQVDQVTIMQDLNFDKFLLKDCIEYGLANLNEEIPPILNVSLTSLFLEIDKIVAYFADTFHDEKNTISCSCLSERNSSNHKKFDLKESTNFLLPVIPCVLLYLESISSINLPDVRQDTYENIVKFNILSLEFVNYMIDAESMLNVELMDYSLKSFNCMLKQDRFFNILNNDIYSSCIAIFNIFKLTEYFSKYVELLEMPCGNDHKNLVTNLDNQIVCESFSHLYSLFHWIYLRKIEKNNTSPFLTINLDSIIISLGRLSLFNNFIVPLKAWNQNVVSNPSSIQNSAIPDALLQDMDILEQYIFRITLLGWNSRQQFEETWMCLLSILCNTSSDDSIPEELSASYASTALAVKGITSLLEQTLFYPVLGKINISKLLKVSRDPPIVCDKLSIKKLKNVHTFIKKKYNNAPYFLERNVNIDSPFDNDSRKYVLQECNNYSPGQVCIKYLLIAVGMIGDIDVKCPAFKVWREREEILTKSGLDIPSCLHFLQDFYTQLLELQKINSLVLLQEIIISILVISDLFNDKSQFSWMLNLFLELLKVHGVEDELLHQYLLIGVCKSAAVLHPGLEIYEIIKKYLAQFLKSTFLPTRMACLHGLLYILEGCKLHNISIGKMSEEFQIILPCAVEYIQNTFDNRNKNIYSSQEHDLLVWDMAFYIIENVDVANYESSFVENVLNNSISVLTNPEKDIEEYKCIIKRLQRLMIFETNILDKNRTRIVKLSLEGLKCQTPFISVSCMQMLFTFMYIECSEHIESRDVATNPEILEQTIEKFSAIFDHIRRGYTFDVEIVCSLLPQILDDFFTPAEILTKVISEFLSTQQPHQKLLSKIVFHVFQSAIKQNQLTLLQDWIVCSLPSFTQNFSYPMATWSLTCFFISASSNEWLTSLFPYVQTRLLRYEHEDREMLCTAGSDFYKNLSTEKQRQTFKENFKIVKNLPEMPFNDLLFSL